MSPARRALTAALAAAALLGGAAVSADVRWPTDRAGLAQADPIASVRWQGGAGWTASDPSAAERVLAAVDAELAARPGDARLHAFRAVVLRVLERYDAARAALDLAIARDRAVLGDADVALTQGYLLARAQRYDEAVAAARGALSRLPSIANTRAPLGIELARWSMARGPEGIPDALAVLQEVAAAGQTDTVVRATLALALSRGGRADEARAVATAGDLPLPYPDNGAGRHGALFNAEADAAIGVAHVLAGRARLALDPLTRAASAVPAPWRAHTAEFLAQARRAASAPEPRPAQRPAAVPAPRLFAPRAR